MQPRYIDTHAHVNFAAYDEDRGEVIDRALAADTWMINVGTQLDTAKTAVELARSYKEGVYAIIGLHPVHTSKSYHDSEELGEGGDEFTSRGEIFSKQAYLELARDPKVVGVGECGLDYYRLEAESIEKQRAAFIAQIEFANEIGKPLMLHVRPSKDSSAPNAYDDAIALLKEYAKVPGNAHFYAGTVEQAKTLFDLGFTISCTGVITFTRDYDGVIRQAPLDKILSETDCPYVTPTPHRGKRNEPVYVSRVVEQLAQVKNLPLEEMREAVLQNAFRLFGF